MTQIVGDVIQTYPEGIITRDLYQEVAKVTGDNWEDGDFQHKVRNAQQSFKKNHSIRLDNHRWFPTVTPDEWAALVREGL